MTQFWPALYMLSLISSPSEGEGQPLALGPGMMGSMLMWQRWGEVGKKSVHTNTSIYGKSYCHSSAAAPWYINLVTWKTQKANFSFIYIAGLSSFLTEHILLP